MIKYSIIIPVYNMEKYISECLGSIIDQNRDDVEIIVVNDGSTDRSLDLIRDIQVSYRNLKLISKKNTGSMDSWITGVKYSSGKYICFADSDDSLGKNYFDTLDKYLSSDTDILVFDYYKCYKNKKEFVKSANLDYGTISSSNLSLLKKDYFANYKLYSFYRWNKVFKRKILLNSISEIDFRTTFFEDLYVGLLTLEKSRKIVYINAALYKYRMRRSSVSHTVSPKVFTDNVIMKKELIKHMRSKKFDACSIMHMCEYMDLGYVRYYLRAKNKPSRIKVTFKMILENPNKEHNKLFYLYKFRLDGIFKIADMIRNRNKKSNLLFE